MTEPALDVKSSFRLVRRLWPWMVVACLIGAAVGASFEFLLAAPYRATSLVLLPTSTAADAGTFGRATITTDARIVDSAAVLTPAARQARVQLSLTQLQTEVTATATAAGVLKITATGSSASQVMRIANAVANQMVVFMTTSGSAANSSAVTALESEVKQVDSQINDIQSELVNADKQLASDRTSSAGTSESQLISKLTAERASLTLQLDTLRSQLSEAQLAGLSTNQGTEVIQPANAATGLSPGGFLLPIVLGIIGGLVVGYLAIVALCRRDRRLRTRDGIAEAVGAPVLFSMEVRPPSSPKAWAELLEHYVPSPSTQWHVRRGLRELGVVGGSPEPKNLRMVAFGDDDGAATAAVEIALISANAGTNTLFSIGGSPGEQVAIRSLCARFDAEEREPRSRLAVHNDLRGPLDVLDGVGMELRILDRAEPEAEASWRSQDAVVLVVSAGRVTAEDLARASIAVDEVGLRVGGIVVANPASEDRTVGRFSEGAVRRTLAQHRRPVDSKTHAAAARSR